MNTENFTIEELDEIKQAVYQVSDAYYALKRIKESGCKDPDLAKMVFDLKEITQNGSVSYFTSVL